MSSPEPKPPAPRSKWAGRIIILFFGALLLVYFVPMFWGLLFPSKN